MCLALLLSCYGASGYYASDDYTYLSSILSLVQNGQFEASLGGVRYPLILPGALVYYLTGSLILTTCFGVIYHPLLVFITYRLGCLIDRQELGIIAGFIVAVLPGFYLYSGTLLPDVTQSFWTALWLYSLLHVHITSGRREKLLWISAVGLLNGFAYLTKESGLLLAVPSFLFLTLGCRGSLLERAKSIFIFSAAFCACFVIEIVLIKIISGQWLWRLGVIAEEEHVNLYLQRMARQGYTVPQRLSYCILKLQNIYGWFLLSLTAVAFCIYPFIKKSSWLVWGTALWLFFYLTIGSTSLSQYLPPSIQERYYTPLLVMAALVIAHVILGLLPKILWFRFRSQQESLMQQVAIVSLAVLTVGWGLRQALVIEEELGSIYRSRETRAFLGALNFYEEELSPMPIVLSSYLSRRMRPILRGASTRLSESILQGDNLPVQGLPFVFIRNATSGTALPQFEWLTNEPAKKFISCSRTFSTARTRFADFLERQRELLLLIRPREAHEDSSFRDIVIQFVLPDTATHSLSLGSKLWHCSPAVFAEDTEDMATSAP